jgi:virginiamycin B lyase
MASWVRWSRILLAYFYRGLLCMKYRVWLLWMLAFLPVCALTACRDGSYHPPQSTPPAPSMTSAQAATGKFQEFALPEQNGGLMRPALDAQGHLWFGEMGRNSLGSFDTHRTTFWQQTPPGGKWGIMGVAVAPDNTIWFAEQDANYLGHYFPADHLYRTYPLPAVSMPATNNAGHILHLPAAPNDIALDQHGMLWFTELNTNAIGRLNPANGSLSFYPLPGTKKGQALDPYGIAVDPGGTVWFTQVTTNRLGRLDPASGQIRYYTPPGTISSFMEVASDPHGQIWATTFAGGQLLRFSPGRASFTIYNAPAPHGASGGLYGLAIAQNGDIWVTVTAENLLARLDVPSQRFFYYSIPTPNSLPLGLVVGPAQRIWFTEAGGNKIGELQL